MKIAKGIPLGVVFLFYFIPFQDLLVSYLYGLGFPHSILKILLVLKELIVLFLGLIIVLVRPKASQMRLTLLFFTLYSSCFIFFSSLSFQNTLLGFRTYLLILFSFVIGEELGGYADFESFFYKHINRVFFIMVVFSVLEYFVLPLSIWKSPFPVMEMKREVAGLSTANEYYDTGLPVNYQGELTRRLLGPFDEPLYMGYYSIIILNFFLAQLFYTHNRSTTKSILGAIIILLTQTRAIIIGLILSFLGIITRRRKISHKLIIISSAAVTLAAGAVIVYYQWFLELVNSLFSKEGRNIGHLDSYIGGVSHLLEMPWGRGIGASSTIVGFSSSNLATENAFINIGIEVGIIGIMWILFVFVFLIIKFQSFVSRNDSALNPMKYSIVAAAYMLVVQFTFAGFVAPHILTARILIPFLIVTGWAYSNSSKYSAA